MRGCGFKPTKTTCIPIIILRCRSRRRARRSNASSSKRRPQSQIYNRFISRWCQTKVSKHFIGGNRSRSRSRSSQRRCSGGRTSLRQIIHCRDIHQYIRVANSHGDWSSSRCRRWTRSTRMTVWSHTLSRS